eukprot:1006372-Karenia_brevis.AAC.1
MIVCGVVPPLMPDLAYPLVMVPSLFFISVAAKPGDVQFFFEALILVGPFEVFVLSLDTVNGYRGDITRDDNVAFWHSPV